MAADTQHPSVAVVFSRYNGSVTGPLREAAEARYAERCGGGAPAVVEAPGAYELIAISAAAARSGSFRGVVALGCVIKGETDHDVYINHAVADGLARISIETGIAVAFGLLTTGDAAQAADRAGGSKGNKGAEAMDAVLDTIAAMDAIERDGAGVRFETGSAAPDKGKA